MKSNMLYKFSLIETEEDENFGETFTTRHIEHVFKDEQYLPDLVSNFENWLRNCGYIFDKIELHSSQIKDTKNVLNSNK